MNVEACDFLVLGAGPAGLAGAREAAALGRDVLVVEAAAGHAVLDAPPERVRVIGGQAQFTSDGDVCVVRGDGGRVVLRASQILIAVGDAPRVPSDVDLADGRIMTADIADEGPAAVLVVGGGPTGVEVAARSAASGVAVTLVERRSRILPGFAADLATRAAAALTSRGVTLRTGVRLAAAHGTHAGAAVQLRGPGGLVEDLQVPRLILAVGRQPRTAELELDLSMVVQDRHGRIQTDPGQETARDGLYAAGGVTGTPTTARTAAAEGRVAALHASGLPFRPVPFESLPRVVSGPLTLAVVGLDDAEAEARGFAAVATVVTAGETFVKLVSDAESGRLLGAHLAGPRAEAAAEVAALLHAEGLGLDAWRVIAPADSCLAEALAVRSTGVARG